MTDIVRFLDPKKALKINPDDICSMADPYNNGTVTFSMFILAAASIKVKLGNEELSLIQFTNRMKKE